MVYGVKTLTIAERVSRELNASINHGIYPPGTRLPGERQLAEDLHVSRSTIRTALEALERDGRLARSAQRGWFVPSPTVGEPPSTLQSFTEMARLRGRTPTAQVLEKSVRSASIDEAERLGIAPGADVLSLIRLRGMDATPICVDRNVIPLSMAQPLVEEELTNASLYESLKTRCAVDIYRSAYSVQADVATADIAGLLRIAPGSPVLIGREVAYDQDGGPVLLGFNTYRGDAYRFEADLYRAG
jgi:GntR family transcriptional regulator